MDGKLISRHLKKKKLNCDAGCISCIGNEKSNTDSCHRGVWEKLPPSTVFIHWYWHKVNFLNYYYILFTHAHILSIWMNEAQTVINFKPGWGTRAGENPALRILFYRLCRLLTLPIIPTFVFDGPGHPKVKRGVNVMTGKSHWLSLPFKKFIEAFSFFWYTVSFNFCDSGILFNFFRLQAKLKLTLLN